MSPIRKILVGGKWIEGNPKHGELYRDYRNEKNYVESYWSEPDPQETEKQWRNSELTRTDDYMMLPDFPYSTELAGYRQLLRDYDFSGERPSLPLTPTGKPIC
jgi:hypothetical protein